MSKAQSALTTIEFGLVSLAEEINRLTVENQQLKENLKKTGSSVDQATRQSGSHPIGKVETPVYPEVTP